MTQFILKHIERENGKITTRFTSEFRAENISDVLDNVEDFLRGCGYVFEGHLTITEDDE